jgi:hypothetical protein
MSLPAWPARNEADNQAMLRWLEYELNLIHDKEIYDLWHQPHFTEAERLNHAIESADIELLRREIVRRIGDERIARFINLPKLKKGEVWSRHADSWIAPAAADVKQIRKLWRQYYGKHRRRKSDGWSAEKFAAEIWTVGVDQLERYLKKH